MGRLRVTHKVLIGGFALRRQGSRVQILLSVLFLKGCSLILSFLKFLFLKYVANV